MNRLPMNRLTWPALVLTVAAALSCGRTHHGKILRFIFDDPPGDAATLTDSTRIDSLASELEASPDAVTDPVPGSSHPPFAERECQACHALTASKSFSGGTGAAVNDVPTQHQVRSRLLLPAEDLCYECHSDMTPDALQARGATIHAPVEGGECLECHHPHQTRFPALLLRGDPIEELCFGCHDSESVLGVDPHGDMEPEERICGECHDPHVSDDEKLLRM
jgi:predicted CXXCH cytochrome family protein